MLVGKSGSGKTTIARSFVDLFGWAEAVSTTTRDPRVGEIEGVDYYFTSSDSFDTAHKMGLFIESVKFNGNSYGMAKKELEQKTALSPTLIVVEPDGASQIRERYQGPIKIIELQVSEETRKDRMLRRGDPIENVEDRLSHDREYWETQNIEYDIFWDNEQDGPSLASLVELAEQINGRDSIV